MSQKRKSSEAATNSFSVVAWASPAFHLLIPVEEDMQVAELKSMVEREFEEQFGLRNFRLISLQDPNHNDLPLDGVVGHLLQNKDRVYVWVDNKRLHAPMLQGEVCWFFHRDNGIDWEYC